MNSCQRLKTLLNDIEDMMDNIFTSGFATIGSHTAEKIRLLAGECGNYGLEYAEAALCRIAGEADEKRHALTFDYSALAEEYCELNQYINTVKSKINCLLARESLSRNECILERD